MFGSLVFIHNHSPHRGKLDPRALKCVFVGYSPTQKGYKCFHPPSKKFSILADVKFVEDQSYFQNSYTHGETNFLGGNAKEFYLPTLPCSSTLSACPNPQDCANTDVKETIQSHSKPLKVYTRRRAPEHPSKHAELSNLSPDQCSPASDFHQNSIQSSPKAESTSPEPLPIDHQPSTLNLDDLDVPIALRKGT